MKICTICGKLLNDDTSLCPSRHRTYADAMVYTTRLARHKIPVTVCLKNGLLVEGTIFNPSGKGIYLCSGTIIGDTLFYSWDELDYIKSGPESTAR